MAAYKYPDLAERLEDYAASVIQLFDKRPNSYAADYLAKQIIRSACSSALNYSEALGAGSDRDKINKLRICLKELRESLRNLSMQSKAKIISKGRLVPLIKENDELIRIIVVRIRNINKVQ